MKKLSLYIHIPFCVRKCLYCDFVSFDGCDDTTKEKYVKALCEEIYTQSLNFDMKEYTVDTVFFGGGTPSILSIESIRRIIDQINKCFYILPTAEISIEINPGTASKNKLCEYKKLGINRVSIGLQSACDMELKALGRIHDYPQFEQTFRWARLAGFENINVDVMSAIPKQNIESYKDTLEKVLELAPEHISAYSLIVEEGTPFYDMDLEVPSEDEERQMYYLTKDILASKGYERYEISNYAKADKECKHNIGYWTGKEYLGLGLNAASYYGGYRRKNTSDIETYLDGEYTDEIMENTRESQMEEYMFLGLRLIRGISISDFEKCFGEKLMTIYGEAIDKHISEGLLQVENDRMFLTDRGIDLSNYVLADFLLD